jgi:hypothetical protein
MFFDKNSSGTFNHTIPNTAIAGKISQFPFCRIANRQIRMNNYVPIPIFAQ